MSVDRTIIKSGEIITPALTANSAIIDKMISLNAENIQSSNAYIENLTIKTLEILDEENGNSNESETFEYSSLIFIYVSTASSKSFAL